MGKIFSNCICNIALLTKNISDLQNLFTQEGAKYLNKHFSPKGQKWKIDI
jgi:hypothetical protein